MNHLVLFYSDGALEGGGGKKLWGVPKKWRLFLNFLDIIIFVGRQKKSAEWGANGYVTQLL